MTRRRTRIRTHVRRGVLGPRPSYPCCKPASIAICTGSNDARAAYTFSVGNVSAGLRLCGRAERVLSQRTGLGAGGRSSGVEHNLAKVGVVGSNPIARSSLRPAPAKVYGGRLRDAQGKRPRCACCPPHPPFTRRTAASDRARHPRGRLPLRRGALLLRGSGPDRGARLRLLDLPEVRLPPSGGAEVAFHPALWRGQVDQLPLRHWRGPSISSARFAA